MLLWAKHDRDKWNDTSFYEGVLNAARESGDSDSKLRLAQALLDAKRLANLGEAIAGVDWEEEVAPTRRQLRVSLRAGQALAETKLDKASSLLREGAEASPAASSLIGATRAVETVEGARSALAWLESQSPEKLTAKAKAIVFAERGRLALKDGNTDEAKRQLKLLRAIPGKANDGWSAVTKARITRAEGDLNGAKAILSRASKGRKNPFLRWSSLKDGIPKRVRRTSSVLSRCSRGPASRRCAAAFRARSLAQGQTERAGEHLGVLMWKRPGEASPMDTSLAYAQWLEASGKGGEAEKVLDKLQSLRPNDPSLVKQLMERARAAGDKAKAAELFQKLLDLESGSPSGDDTTP